MRPAKHATHSHTIAQEIFAISIAQLGGKKEGLPIAATSEPNKITVFAWHEGGSRWRSRDIPHVTLAVPRGVPSVSNTWNWSRRVGLATFDDTIAVVYKRADTAAVDQPANPALLMLETFTIGTTGLIQQTVRVPVPMPSYEEAVIGFPPRIVRKFETPGFELWAGVDLFRRRLLIVTQSLGKDATSEGDGAKLVLISGDLDALEDVDAWNSQVLDDGGYALDVRHVGDELILAYRTTAESLRVPLPPRGIDPFFSGWPSVELDASPSSDQFYPPVRLMRVDLATLGTSKLELPGGEHPRIQSVDPVFVTVDRPQLRARFRVVETAGAAAPQIDWEARGVFKLGLLLDDNDRLARGVLTSFLEGDRPTLARTAAPWVDGQDLFTPVTIEGIGWASTMPRFPLEPLRFDSDEKGVFFDFLNKAPLFALVRSRARLISDFVQGVLTVSDLTTAVYDINHDQILAPEGFRPDVTGENAQFAPFQRLSQQSGDVMRAPAYFADNTIGGSLVTDRDGVPYRFISYVDSGDGGLRVIYDADLGPPDAPPPVTKPKTLEPESVPGPGSGDERWVELKTDGWRDAPVPAIALESLLVQKTVTSAVHSQIESLLEAGVTLANLNVDEENGWTENQVNSIQTALNGFLPSQPDTRFSTEAAGVPRSFISISPPEVVADAATVFEAGVEGETVTAVTWTFTGPTIIAGPVVIGATGNPATVSLFPEGDWTISAAITRADNSVRTFGTTITAEPSLFNKTASLHRELSNQDIEPPLNAVGGYRIGTATFRFLQYELKFPVDADAFAAHSVVIKSLDKTDAQWRFRANGTGQGLIDYRLRITFDSSDFRLEGLLAALINLERVSASFFYGRSFTPGILMNDSRNVAPLTGATSPNDGLRQGVDQDEIPRLSSGLTARPYGDASITVETVDAKVSMLPQAVAASVITLLVGLAAATAAATLTALVGALGIAIAVASAPGIGVAGAAAAVALAVAVFLFITFAVPPIIESAVEENVKKGLTSAHTRRSLEGARFLQFAGEGLAETIAREALAKAIDDGAEADPPAVSAELIGLDRYRQNLYQMIHVSENRCRVLIRG